MYWHEIDSRQTGACMVKPYLWLLSLSDTRLIAHPDRETCISCVLRNFYNLLRQYFILPADRMSSSPAARASPLTCVQTVPPHNAIPAVDDAQKKNTKSKRPVERAETPRFKPSPTLTTSRTKMQKRPLEHMASSMTAIRAKLSAWNSARRPTSPAPGGTTRGQP